MYTFSQKNLTTHTEATVTVGFMEVAEGKKGNYNYFGVRWT
jgi:hypothetical protein